MATDQKTSSALLKRLVLSFLVLVVLLLAGLVFANLYLNPLVFRTAEIKNVAKITTNGTNFGIYDANINWRALRREQIRMLKEAPNVIVSGGSRWQEASSIHTPGKSFYNASVHSDFSEDFFALVHMLEESGKLPDTLILSLRYRTFNPISRRDHTGWKEWAPEYEDMMVKLGLEQHPSSDTRRVEHWSALLSIKDLVAQAKRRFGSGEHPRVISETNSKTLDVTRSDGSLQWSENNSKRFTPAFAEADSVKRLERFRDYELVVDPAQVEATDKLFSYLKSKNIKVIIAQTPFHPTFYQGVKNTQFGRTLDDIEELARALAKKYDYSVAGSFDPDKVGCSKNEFIDWHHGTPDCLAKVFAEMVL